MHGKAITLGDRNIQRIAECVEPDLISFPNFLKGGLLTHAFCLLE
jgi:hypothetical protein